MPELSSDRLALLEKIKDVRDFGYLSLAERRALVQNTYRVVKQSEAIDREKLPAPEANLLSALTKTIKIAPDTKVTGYVWFNNGEKNIRLPVGKKPPEGFTKGRRDNPFSKDTTHE